MDRSEGARRDGRTGVSTQARAVRRVETPQWRSRWPAAQSSSPLPSSTTPVSMPAPPPITCTTTGACVPTGAAWALIARSPLASRLSAGCRRVLADRSRLAVRFWTS